MKRVWPNKWGLDQHRDYYYKEDSRHSMETNKNESFLHVFQEFCCKTSMHGWGFVGAPSTPVWHRIFWLLVIFSSVGAAVYLLKDTVDDFTSYTTKINIEDRSKDLEEAFFPSVVVCNINPLRKSFIYWIHNQLEQQGLTNISKTQIFNLIGRQFFKTKNEDITPEDEHLLDFILDSQFFEEYFRKFLAEMKKKSGQSLSKTEVYFYNHAHVSTDSLGPYNNLTKRVYHENFFHEIAGQWRVGQMIPFLMWNGMNPKDPSNRSGVYFETGFGTSYGVCSWITPFYQMPEQGSEAELGDLQKGALNGENNGLSFLLDAETYDYGNGFYELGERAGEGFKVGIVHHMDMPIIQQSAVYVNPGKYY